MGKANKYPSFWYLILPAVPLVFTLDILNMKGNVNYFLQAVLNDMLSSKEEKQRGEEDNFAVWVCLYN